MDLPFLGGPPLPGILFLLQQLAEGAEAAGGAVYVLNGNHEARKGDVRRANYEMTQSSLTPHRSSPLLRCSTSQATLATLRSALSERAPGSGGGSRRCSA